VNIVKTFARDTGDYLRGIERAENISIRRIAIDACYSV
jgi:hypothetical protein